MQDEKVTLQLGKLAGLAVFGEVVKEPLAKLEAASCEGDLGHALGFEVRQTIAEELGNVGGIGWCANGGHPAGFRNAAGGSKHRRTTEAVTDEKRGSLVFRAQEGERLIAVVGELTGRAVRVLLRMRVDRKSVVEGKSVDRGGRRIIKKNMYTCARGQPH